MYSECDTGTAREIFERRMNLLGALCETFETLATSYGRPDSATDLRLAQEMPLQSTVSTLTRQLAVVH